MLGPCAAPVLRHGGYRRAVRQASCRPLIDALEIYLREQFAKLSRGHDLAKAIQYMLKRRPAFTLFLMASVGSVRVGAGRLSMHVNKVDHVTTVERIAERLGESVDFIHDVALEMDTEDGVISVHGIGDDGVLAFTDFGVETLVELIEIHKDPKSRAGA